MELKYVDPYVMTAEQFDKLCEGGVPGGWQPSDIAQKLLSKAWLAFETGGGMFAVEKKGTRLYVTALAIDRFGWRLRAFRDIMDRLATDLMCDTVETMCFDERLAHAMMRIRAKPEAWKMVWQVEGTSNG